jgi:ParB/RepB/Spo0J family partition protein
MILSQQFDFIDPKLITIHRDARQRKAIDTTGLIESIKARGVYNPVIVTRDLVLVAGERRLTCCLELGIPVPIRYADTLTDVESQIIELEENLKRSDLPWQDMAKSIANLHEIYVSQDPEWTQEKTGESIGLVGTYINRILRVASMIDSPILKEASGISSAYNILTRLDNRIASNVMSTLIENTGNIFRNIGQPAAPAATPAPVVLEKPKFPDSILLQDFLTWAPGYSGRLFNVIHCDFPYGVNVFAGKQMSKQSQSQYDDSPDVYWALIDCLLKNLDKLLSQSGHVIFWFSMQHYQRTKDLLESRLVVNPYPFVWVKSDNKGVLPDANRGPRQIYETAFICYRGDRPIIKAVSNAYSASSDKSIHPSAKPEPVLKHLFTMLIDGTARLLDPTCGGGTSLRAAEALGAEEVLGMDIDPEHVQNAKDALRNARVLRNIAR